MEIKVIFKTARSIVLEIVDELADYKTANYDLYVDGEKRFTSDKTIVSYMICFLIRMWKYR